MAFSLDHIVINTLFEMDAAQVLMRRLGFTLTPRGHHSLGSINHLMMFEGHYLELVGLPLGTDVLRNDVRESPLGLNGLVFRTGDVDACIAQLEAGGLPTLAPQSFSRPVTLDGIAQLARFRTVRTAPDLFAAGRVYYCQHDTPELVWRPEWMAHPNGCTGLSELVVVTTDADRDVPRYASAAQARADTVSDGISIVTLPDAFRITLLSPARYTERYGDLGVESDGRSSFFGALVVTAPDPGRIARDAAGIAGLRTHDDARSLVLSVASLNTLLEFRNDRG